jgi:two-component system KDP operon response regulator KdpE
MGERILVIDDNDTMREGMTVTLKKAGHDVLAFRSGVEGVAAFKKQGADLVVTDLKMEAMDGIEVVHGLRGWSDVPIIMLSVRRDEGDKVEALDAGADAYLTKPFGMGELLARLRAALRRGAPSETEPVIEAGSLRIDLTAKRVQRDGADVHLTPTEWGIVDQLARNPGKLVTQRQLLQAVWGPEYGTEAHYLRVYMAALRRKLEDDPSRPRHFLTEPGMGYRFEV